MSEEEVIEMFVGGMALDPNSHVPVIVLRDAEDKMHIPIWIGPSEATSIATVVRGAPLTRPLAHDLMCGIMQEANIKVHHVTITDLRDATYYAEMEVLKGEKVVVFDARPSDAIAIALRAHAPILVVKKVIAEASIIAQVIVKEQQERQARRTIIDDDFNGGIIDANSGGIDKRRWKEVLEKLNPNDFKFKV